MTEIFLTVINWVFPLIAKNVTGITLSWDIGGKIIFPEQTLLSHGIFMNEPIYILNTHGLSVELARLNTSTVEKSKPTVNSVTADYPELGSVKIWLGLIERSSRDLKVEIAYT